MPFALLLAAYAVGLPYEAFASDGDLDFFEEHYDVLLLRDRSFSFAIDEEGVQDEGEFVPALYRAGVRFSSWTGGPIFLGALRVSEKAVAGGPLWLAVTYEPDGEGQYQYVYVDAKGETVAKAGIGVLDPGGSGDPVIIDPPPDETSEIDPIPILDFVYPTFPQQPSTDWPDFEFVPPDGSGSHTIPQVISLVHGRTNDPGTEPYQLIGTPAHAFHYWGFDFITELLGVSGAQSLRTFDISANDVTAIARDVWQQGGYSNQTFEAIYHLENMVRNLRIQVLAYNVAAAFNYILCAIVSPSYCIIGLAYTAQAVIADQNLQADLLKLDELRKDKVRLGNFLYHPGSPQRVVMLTHRDGSRALAEQSSFVIRQVAVLYQTLLDNWFDPELHKNPPIYFVSHSMGGLVLRHMLTAPTEPVGGPALDPSSIMHAKEIAARTVALITVQTPHEGSPGAAHAKELTETIHSYEELLFVMRPPREAAMHRLIGSPSALFDTATGATLPATAHLEEEFWAKLNSAELAPQNLRRPDGSLIPVYPILGRTPSAGRFNDPAWSEDRELLESLASLPLVGGIPASILRLFGRSRVKKELESIGQEFGANVAFDTLGLMVGDGFLLRVNGGWGDPVQAQGSVDLMRRRAMPYVTVASVFPNLYLHPDEGNEQDNDGLVPSVSALGVRLGTQTSDYFCHSRTWIAGGVEPIRGSWYRTYRTHEEWDWSNHSSIKWDTEAGQWLRFTLLGENRAGPYVGPGDVSQWWPE